MTPNSIMSQKQSFQDDVTFQSLRKNERELRKNLIINATRKILKRKAQNTIAMKDIANEVGLAPASIYSYFRSQEELFLEVFLNDLTYIDTIIKENLDSSLHKTGQSAADNLGDAVDYLMSSEAIFQVITYLMAERNLPENVIERIEKLKQTMFKNVTVILNMLGVKNTDEATLQAFFASILGTIILYRNTVGKEIPSHEVSIKEIIRTLIDVFKTRRPLPERNHHFSQFAS